MTCAYFSKIRCFNQQLDEVHLKQCTNSHVNEFKTVRLIFWSFGGVFSSLFFFSEDRRRMGQKNNMGNFSRTKNQPNYDGIVGIVVPFPVVVANEGL